MNGCGERTGNANLVSIIAQPAAQDRLRCLTEAQLARLTETAHFVDEILNVTPDPNQPYVGRNAFAHKGGMHVAGVAPTPPPSSTSTRRWSATSASCSCRSSPAAKHAREGRRAGVELDAATRDASHRTRQGARAPRATSSRRPTARSSCCCARDGRLRAAFRLESWRVIVEQRADGASRPRRRSRSGSTATGGRIAEGNGPVNALDRALRAAIGEVHPHLADIELVNFKVRILDADKGTGAVTRVLLDASDGTASGARSASPRTSSRPPGSACRLARARHAARAAGVNGAGAQDEVSARPTGPGGARGARVLDVLRSGRLSLGPLLGASSGASRRRSARRSRARSRAAPPVCTWRCARSACATATRSSRARCRSSPPPTRSSTSARGRSSSTSTRAR